MPTFLPLSKEEISSAWLLAEYLGELNPIMVLYSISLLFSTRNTDDKIILAKMFFGMLAFVLSNGNEILANDLTEHFRGIMEDIDFDFYNLNMDIIN